MIINSSPENLQCPKDARGILYLNNPMFGDFRSDNFFRKIARINCKSCNASLSSIEKWKTHQIVIHNDIVVYGRKIKSTIWENKGAVPNGTHPCGECAGRFSQARIRRRHERTEAYRVMLVCVVCDKLCEDVERHMKLYHPEFHTCKECGVNILDDPVAHYDNVHQGFDGVLQLVDILCAGDGSGYFVHESALTLNRKLSGKGAFVRGHASVLGDSSSLVETLRLDCSPGIRITRMSYLRAINLFPATPHARVRIMNSRGPPVFKCRICGYAAQNLHKTREMVDHAITEHFNKILSTKISKKYSCICPHNGCTFSGTNQQIKRHYLSMHISHELLFE